MPNWSYNILNASDEVLKQIVNEEGEIDFNTVVPMPKELQGTVSPRKDDTQEEKDASKNWLGIFSTWQVALELENISTLLAPHAPLSKN